MTIDQAAPLPASFRSGRYRVERLLGEGSQGETFAAVDTTDGARVSVKRFRVRGAKSWKDVELAEREAHVLASLTHPNIPRYRDRFEEDGALMLVTDYIEGDNLASLRKDGVRFTESDVLRFLRDASNTLAYLHGRAPPVIHRDIKPGNVIRRSDGSYALIDFGSVRDRMKPEGGSTVVGTFGFMAPEQFQGRAMPGSDVYAVGATAMSLITGREPEELPHKGLAIDVRAALAGSHLRPALIDALSTMLDPDPDRRPSSLAPVVAQLDAPPPRVEPVASAPWKTAPPTDQPFANWDKSWMPRKARRAIEKAERRTARAIERAQRRAERSGRWSEDAATRQIEFERGMAKMRDDVGRLSGVPRLFVFFGLTMALVGVTVALKVIVPLVLRLLSLIFGKPLRVAAESVSNAGDTASKALQKTLDSFAQPVAAGPRVEVPKPETGVRVETTAGDRAGDVEVPRANDSTGTSALRNKP